MLEVRYHESITKALDTFQTLESKRIDSLGHVLCDFANVINDVSSKLYKNSTILLKKAKNVDAKHDLQTLVELKSNNKPCPWLDTSNNESYYHTLDDDNEQVPSGILARKSINPFSRKNIISWQNKTTIIGKSSSINSSNDENKNISSSSTSKFKAMKHRRQVSSYKDNVNIEEQLLEEKKQADLIAQEQATITDQVESLSLNEKISVEIGDEEGSLELAKLKLKEQEDLLESKRVALEKAAYNLSNTITKTGTNRYTKFINDLNYGWNGDYRTPIIIDNGESSIKAGYSGDRFPSLSIANVCAEFTPIKAHINSDLMDEKQYIFGDEALHVATGLLPYDDKKYTLRVNPQVWGDTPSNWDDLEHLWEKLFDDLGADPSQHPILLTQPTLPPTKLQENMLEIMYEKLGVAACYIATGPLLAAYAFGASTGLVVDVGHSSAQVLPIIDGFSMDVHARRVYHLGGKKDTLRIQDFLTSKLTRQHITPYHLSTMARQIKDTLAYCSNSNETYINEIDVFNTVKNVLEEEEDGQYDDDNEVQDDDLSQSPQDYKEQDTNIINKDDKMGINPIELQTHLLNCGEILFTPKEILNDYDESIVSVTQMVDQVVKACDLDTRPKLLSNIFLSGGVTTMPGFKERLLKELKMAIPYARKINVYSGEESRYAIWTGGSVLSSLESFQDAWVPREVYEEYGYNPDDNQIEDYYA